MSDYRQPWERVPEGPKPERSRVDDYTPTTDEVRAWVIAPKGTNNSLARAQSEAVGTWFDRWLAEHDRQVEARGLEAFGNVVDTSPAALWAGKGGVKEMLAARAQEIRGGGASE